MIVNANFVELSPAYGRDYNSVKDAIADFKAGKDFILPIFLGGTYCNKENFTTGQTVLFRYNHLTKVDSYKIK